ncbi:MAG: signal peptide peptidase SppA [Bacteroidetes bacterium]|nr:signal peptide peptidase SppA [Bacteroidota bacterium]
MRRIVVILLLLTGALFVPNTGRGQDLLVNPQNQKYIFTAGNDGTDGFLYNPAYLGLYDRGSVLDAYYFYPSEGRLLPVGDRFHDFGAFAQGGKLGLAYRNAASSSQYLNQYSVGLGLGNQRAAIGVALSLMNITGLGSRWFPSVGLIWRPDRYLSFGAAYHNFTNKPFGIHPIEKTANFGIGIRPFGTDFLTVSGDIITPVHNDGYKIGASLELVPGFKLFGIYDRSGYAYEPNAGGIPVVIPSAQPTLPSVWGPATVSFGISFNFGSHIYLEGMSSYQSARYAATYGRVMLTSQDLKTIVPEKRIAEIVIRGGIHDGLESTPFFVKPRKTLLDYVHEIRQCGDDQSIKALILKIYPFSTSESFFTLSAETQELADAVKYVRQKGKKVYAFLADDSGVNELYLATAANKIYMAPVTFVSGYGINLDLVRLKGFFDRLHISWNARTAGKYKSTFHTEFTDSATPDQSKLINGLVENVYSQMISQIEVNRHISPGEGMREEISGLVSASRAAEIGLTDGVAYYGQFKKDVNKDVFGVSKEAATADPARIEKYATRWGEKPEVAVVGVYGAITTGESSPPSPFPIPFLGGDRTTGSETVVRQIREAASNGNIKAIVLRVNSGGGSALASDEIYNAIKEARSKKPVVASFANMAASGGYYVAAGVQRIFAEPATVTGSIGVEIEFPVITDFLEKNLGANVEKYKEGKYSDLLSPFHAWNSNDNKYIDEFLNETYNDFMTKVAEGRKLSLSRVSELAQGKVYTGMQAKSDDLIDEYGGLDKAIKYAADLAGIPGNYRVKMFPVPGFSLGSFFKLATAIMQMVSD